jgi:hypothetical protein
MTLEQLLLDTTTTLHPVGFDFQELLERQVVMSIAPSVATFTDPDGEERPFIALEVLGVNGIGDTIRSVLLFSPEAMTHIGKVLLNIGHNLEPTQPDEPTPNRYGYL